MLHLLPYLLYNDRRTLPGTYSVPHRDLHWPRLVFLGLTADVVEGEKKMVGICQLGWELDFYFLIEIWVLVVISHCCIGLPG